ncbi:MAG: hypothetical protein ACR2IF_04685 [Terriglobales bacterium]
MLDRQVRRIPVSAVNLDATIAANQQRGILLHVPTGPGEYSLSF